MLTENIIFLIQSLRLFYGRTRRFRALSFSRTLMLFEFPGVFGQHRDAFLSSANLRDLMRGARRLGRSPLIDTSHAAN